MPWAPLLLHQAATAIASSSSSRGQQAIPTRRLISNGGRGAGEACKIFYTLFLWSQQKNKTLYLSCMVHSLVSGTTWRRGPLKRLATRSIRETIPKNGTPFLPAPIIPFRSKKRASKSKKGSMQTVHENGHKRHYV